mmetsp:Transcript_30596/g.41443  ORF Transcript_30596/g.41443 Transcript_30596/m.41443 type:complete len:108 (+) Transcript_30596:401-724(+)
MHQNKLHYHRYPINLAEITPDLLNIACNHHRQTPHGWMDFSQKKEITLYPADLELLVISRIQQVREEASSSATITERRQSFLKEALKHCPEMTDTKRRISKLNIFLR